VTRDLRDRLQVNAALGQPRDQRAPPAVRGRTGDTCPYSKLQKLKKSRSFSGIQSFE
jgi:hypothetical protein